MRVSNHCYIICVPVMISDSMGQSDIMTYKRIELDMYSLIPLTYIDQLSLRFRYFAHAE